MSAPRRRTALLLLAAVAVAIRLSLFVLEPVIQPDGLNYVESGVNMVAGRGYVNDEGDFRGKLQPLFPFFVGLANLVVRDDTVAGALVSVVFGTLLLWPMFRFAEQAYGLTAAWVAAGLVTVYPYLANYGSTAMTEATYTFFFTLTAWLGWRAWHSDRLRDWALCAVAAALTYLTRFEVAAFLAVFAVAALVVSRGRRWKPVVVLLALFVVLIVPYHLYNRAVSGSAMLLGRLDNSVRYNARVLQVGDPDAGYSAFFGSPAAFARRYVKSVGVMYTEYLPTLFPPLLTALTGAGLAVALRRRAIGFTEAYLVGIVTLCLFGYALLRPSGRNLTVAIPFLLLLLARGVAEFAPVAAEWVAGVTRRRVSAGAVAAALTVFLAVSVMPQTYRPLIAGADPGLETELMEMGRWIKQNLPAEGTVATWSHTVAFYADRPVRYVSRRFEYDDLVATARTSGARYLALSARFPSGAQWQALQARLKQSDDVRLVHTIRRAPFPPAQLYELVEPRTAAAQAPGAAPAR